MFARTLTHYEEKFVRVRQLTAVVDRYVSAELFLHVAEPFEMRYQFSRQSIAVTDLQKTEIITRLTHCAV